jgi:hypothetical protein
MTTPPATPEPTQQDREEAHRVWMEMVEHGYERAVAKGVISDAIASARLAGAAAERERCMDACRSVLSPREQYAADNHLAAKVRGSGIADCIAAIRSLAPEVKP